MSDSDCSNCEKENCEYKETDYTCFVKTAKRVKQYINPNESKQIRDMKFLMDFLYNIDNDDCFQDVSRALENIIQYLDAKI